MDKDPLKPPALESDRVAKLKRVQGLFDLMDSEASNPQYFEKGNPEKTMEHSMRYYRALADEAKTLFEELDPSDEEVKANTRFNTAYKLSRKVWSYLE